MITGGSLAENSFKTHLFVESYIADRRRLCECVEIVVREKFIARAFILYVHEPQLMGIAIRVMTILIVYISAARVLVCLLSNAYQKSWQKAKYLHTRISKTGTNRRSFAGEIVFRVGT